MHLPPVPESFYWDETPSGPVLKCRALEAIAPHVFTTRQLPLASADDWRRIASLLDASSAVTLHQVHGRTAVTIRRGRPAPTSRQEGDVLVSDACDVAIAIRAADCVPLLMADSTTGAVAAVHAGWRG